MLQKRLHRHLHLHLLKEHLRLHRAVVHPRPHRAAILLHLHPVEKLLHRCRPVMVLLLHPAVIMTEHLHLRLHPVVKEQARLHLHLAVRAQELRHLHLAAMTVRAHLRLLRATTAATSLTAASLNLPSLLPTGSVRSRTGVTRSVPAVAAARARATATTTTAIPQAGNISCKRGVF